jgi:hypothetical protein
VLSDFVARLRADAPASAESSAFVLVRAWQSRNALLISAAFPRAKTANHGIVTD